MRSAVKSTYPKTVTANTISAVGIKGGVRVITKDMPAGASSVSGREPLYASKLSGGAQATCSGESGKAGMPADFQTRTLTHTHTHTHIYIYIYIYKYIYIYLFIRAADLNTVSDAGGSDERHRRRAAGVGDQAGADIKVAARIE